MGRPDGFPSSSHRLGTKGRVQAVDSLHFKPGGCLIPLAFARRGMT